MTKQSAQEGIQRVGVYTPMLEISRQARNECLQKLTRRDHDLLLARYATHGAVQQAAKQRGIRVDRLYRVMAKLRTALLDCIEATLRRKGWQNV